MSYYIVCQRKRNNPRMDIRICQHKCPEKEDCQAFLASQAVGQKAEHSTLAAKPRSVEMGAA